MVEVVGSHADTQQPMEESLHRFQVIIDPGKQYRLAAERNARVRKSGAGVGNLGSDLIRMGEMDVDPQGMEAFQYPGQRGRDSLGQNDGCLRTDTDDLHVWNASQSAEQPSQRFVRKCQRIPAGDQDIAYGTIRFDVSDRLVPSVPVRDSPVVPSHHAGPSAVTAVCGTSVGDKEKDPIRIAVNDPGYGARAFLPERVIRLTGRPCIFLRHGNDRLSERLGWVFRVEQTGVVRCDAHAERPHVPLNRTPLLFGKRQEGRQVSQVRHPIAHLPFPVVPVRRARHGERTSYGIDGIARSSFSKVRRGFLFRSGSDAFGTPEVGGFGERREA